MPKAELHLHLDGSLRIDTALELARTRAIDAPRDWAGMSRALIAPMPCADQAELLRAFDLPIALLQDAEALERVAAELVETKAADGVRYVEIRWGPLLHVAGGLSLADGIAAVCRGAQDAAHRTGTVVRLIATALRSHDPEANVTLAETAVRFRDQGLTGWDLAGPEEAFPDPLVHRGGVRGGPGGRPADHHPRRRMGRRGAGPAGPRGRARADRARPRRRRRPGAVRRAHRASRDARPVSDLELAGRDRAVRGGRIRWPGSSASGCPSRSARTTRRSRTSTCPRSTIKAVETIGLTVAELWEIDRHALNVAFASEDDLAPLRDRFAAWGDGIPELAED